MTSIGKDGKKNSKKNDFFCLETATRAGWQQGQALVALWPGCVAQGEGSRQGAEQEQQEAGMAFPDGSFI